MTKLNIVIIGAGYSGLCSAKNALASGHSATIYEQTSSLGGQWVYTDETGTDEYGLDIHTSMYQDLYTNVPKEVMGFPDFPMPSTLRKSYIESGAVLSYLQTYANHFKIVERIRFRHYVIRVRPVEGSKWEIIVKDLLNNKVNTLIYDAVFVCNGNLNTPAIPKPYPGEKLFRGKQIHSHNFRRKEAYEGKNVLLIGAGASGRDLSYLLSSVAKRIYFSHHGHNLDHVYPSNVVRIAAVKELTETGAIFADGSQHELDNIIYCTGYKTAFPFLNVECGISVDQNYVQPLYKDILNINHPTMAFMGLTYGASLGHTLDLQARFMLKVWSGEKSLPSIDDMKADTQRYKEIRRAAGFPQKKYHVLFGINRIYFDELATFADIEGIQNVYVNILSECVERYLNAPDEFRSDYYHIIDDDQYEKITLDS